MFQVKKCQDCRGYKEDEEIVIDHQHIFIYQVFRLCEVDDDGYQDLIFYSKRLKLLYKDAIYGKDDSIILFLENFKIDESYDLLEVLLGFEKDIHIVTL